MKKYFIASFCFLHGLVFAQWAVKSPFEQKVFIENKGQYEIKNNIDSKDILYWFTSGWIAVLFY
jgi:hypothetical protein